MKKILLLSVLTTMLFVSACKKDEDAPSPSNTNAPFNQSTVGSFSATINGNAVNYSIDYQNYFEIYSSDLSIGDSSHAIYTTSISKLVGQDYEDVVGISKGTLHFVGGFYPDTMEFRSFYNPGTYAFSDAAKNGIEIVWYDSNGQRWSSSGIDQTGSVFTIEKRITYSVLGEYVVKYKAIFNCKLSNGTQTVPLTNGALICTIGG